MPKKKIKKTIFKKLVRDEIPKIIERNGGVPKILKLDRAEEYRRALIKKLLEEVKELKNARNRKELVGELADVEEVLLAIAKDRMITRKDIEKVRKEKLRERGGFDGRIFLVYVDE